MKKPTEFNHKQIEKKWQKRWHEEGLYQPDIEKARKPFYNLWMFPYPSAEGLHAGHAFASTGSDIYGRFIRMCGHDVFQPIGYDSFGIHSENFAIKINQTPQEMIARITRHYEEQLRSLGHGYDWTRTVTTSDISYYKWTQWLFVEMYKAGLVYKKKSLVNFCPSCKTVLADEQIMTPKQAGKEPKDATGNLVEGTEDIRVCERCGTVVERRTLDQWFFRITDYADRLLNGLVKIDWSQRVVAAQKEWIGEKDGFVVEWEIKGRNGRDKIKTFTTRLDTIFGTTFLAVAPEHPIVSNLLGQGKEVMNYVSKALIKSEQSRKVGEKEKAGVKTNFYAIHPITEEEIPIWIADFILMDVGTGAVMGVPAHDQRDFDFALTNRIPIKQVILCNQENLYRMPWRAFEVGTPDSEKIKTINKEVKSGKLCYEGYGTLVNSGKNSGLSSLEAMEKLASENVKIVKRGKNYHLRDWLISRQRYWGPPIPMIYCEKCAKDGKSWFTQNKPKIHNDQSDWECAGWYPEEKLPVELPVLKEYRPKGEGKGPLANHPEFYKRKCPSCGLVARRETDVLDTFVDSSWYFLRYPSVGSRTKDTRSFDPEITKKWLPVNLYFGGAEHSVLHLMYARFVTMVLHDLKHTNFEEPFPKFFAHGLMIKGGAKMSKSRGNVVNPDEYIERFGADVLRLYLMFMGPMDGSPDFRDTGIEGMQRFVKKVWKLFIKGDNTTPTSENDTSEILIKMHQTIKRVTENIQKFRYNTAIAAIMEFVNILQEKSQSGSRPNSEALETLALLLAPFTPHLAEEVWAEILGQRFSIHTHPWPKYDPDFIKEDVITIVIQVNGKFRGQIEVSRHDGGNKKRIVELATREDNIFKWLKEKEIRKTILVSNKLINFVTN